MNPQKQLRKAQEHANKMRIKREIESIYHAYDKPKKKISSGKIFLGLVLGDFLLIQLFCMWFMYKYPEYGDLGALIGIAIAILGQLGALIGYFKKSTAENTVGGIVYDSALQRNNDDSFDEEAVG